MKFILNTFTIVLAIFSNNVNGASVNDIHAALLQNYDNNSPNSVTKKVQDEKYNDATIPASIKKTTTLFPSVGSQARVKDLDKISKPRIRSLPQIFSRNKSHIARPYYDALANTSRAGQLSQVSQLMRKVFDIKSFELSQFLFMSTMMFLFIYMFTTVRDIKDPLIVSNCGAEAIPFLKLYGVMPCSMIFLVIYSKLAGILSTQGLFYTTLTPFFVFYIVFAYVLFPLRDTIHFDVNAVSNLGVGTAATSLIQYWSYSLFFIVSEVWASAGIPILFWQCANDVTPLEQAKRFYPLFAVIGNLAPIISGKVMLHFVSLQSSSDDVGFGQSLQKLASVKAIIYVGIIALYKRVYAMTEHRKTETAPPKRKPSLRDSFKEISRSSALRSIAVMVICYNVCVELSEVLWKGLLRKMYPNKSAYMGFMAEFSQKVGIVALIMQLLAPKIINFVGWKWTSLMTPLIMGSLAIPFFIAVIVLRSQTDWESNAKSGGLLTLAGALAIGTWQIVASKVTKYSLFDPCKEMAYIPLDPELKVKGKAAVEVMGSRIGRSFGSISQQLLVLFVGGGSIINCVPFIGILYMAIVGFWVTSVCTLAKVVDNSEDDDSATSNSK